MRSRRILFAGFVVRMEDSRLPKCVLFGELVGGQEKEWIIGCLLNDLRAFGINDDQCGFLFIYFIFLTCIGIPIYVGYFVCDSASEFGAMGSTSFFGVFLP